MTNSGSKFIATVAALTLALGAYEATWAQSSVREIAKAEKKVLKAARKGQLDKIVQLRAKTPEVSLDVADKQGRTAVSLAAMTGDMRTVDYLVEEGADGFKVTSNGDSLLRSLAIGAGKSQSKDRVFAAMSDLLSKAEWDEAHINSVAHVLDCKVDERFLALLLENGADANSRSTITYDMAGAHQRWHNQPLLHKQMECEGYDQRWAKIKLLLENGADPIALHRGVPFTRSHELEAFITTTFIDFPEDVKVLLENQTSETFSGSEVVATSSNNQGNVSTTSKCPTLTPAPSNIKASDFNGEWVPAAGTDWNRIHRTNQINSYKFQGDTSRVLMKSEARRSGVGYYEIFGDELIISSGSGAANTAKIYDGALIFTYQHVNFGPYSDFCYVRAELG